jgi:hypothetical protein
MTDTPPDWVLIEAAKRFGWNDVSEYVRAYYATNDLSGYRALCDMIAKHEQPPVDRKLLCALEAGFLVNGEIVKNGSYKTATDVAIRAIELWEEGFGK